MSKTVFVYGTLLGTQRNRIDVISRTPHTLWGAKLYKHENEDFPTLQLTGDYSDEVEGELIVVSEETYRILYDMESREGYFVGTEYKVESDLSVDPNTLIHVFHKNLSINYGKGTKSGYKYVGNSWLRWLRDNPED